MFVRFSAVFMAAAVRSAWFRRGAFSTRRPAFALWLLALSSPAALAAGDAAKGRQEWENTCQHCHGTPQPNDAAAFSDYGVTANRLAVYASDPAAITRAANAGYTIPEGNTNDKEDPGGSTNRPMGTWAGMASNRLGYGATPTQYAADFSAYFATYFNAPGKPAITAVTPGNGQAVVSFTAPKSDLTVMSYTVTAHPGGRSASGAASPIAVSGLANGVSYTFTVSAASNAGGGGPSAPSAAVTPSAKAGAPALAVAAPAALPVKAAMPAAPVLQAAGVTAPVIKFARAGNAQARIFFDVPAGSAVTGYTVTVYSRGAPTGITATGTRSPITVTGLTNGTDYTFTLTANSGKRPGATSAPSNVVTPLRLLGD